MLQEGLPLAAKDFKPMPGVGAGVYEMRVRAGLQYRIFYVTKLADAIFVLHAFVKKTQKTNKAEINIAADRYKQLKER